MPEVTANMLRHAAMNLLVQKNYSHDELAQKLSYLSDNDELILDVLDRLEKERLLSNERYVEGFIQHRAAKGQGPSRIAQDLEKKGIDPEMIVNALKVSEINWQELAKSVRQQKFGHKHPRKSREINEQREFLQSRGFPAELLANLF
ncbi:regulatory protein RecX [Endozoicomonas sp. GU-1]|uniref:regulatory protein RecX n=1 Tax=Endozoicomonas sp. GU-1 TaxID=3009078 RepID=UPI0022B44D4B|nr:regulatory protein RecX [Endozoicomonas sp. GU-1]WBA82845.1 regulatory protein RecX [Endozoicomonas sp. GU-1]WBA85773.1 regulatory protein RecX [Endozoicomonas sp. GU-1]